MRVLAIVGALCVVACGGDDGGADPGAGGASGAGASGTGGTGTGGTGTGGTAAGGTGTGGAAGSTSTGGAAGSTSTGGTAGDTSTGGTGTGGTGTGGTGGGGSCPTLGTTTAGNHIVVQLSWAATTGLAAGSGEMHIWTKTELTFNGTQVTGTTHACGSVIPPLDKSAIAGGGKVQTLFPDSVWDSPSLPTFPATGTISGFDPGATIAMDPVVTVIGTTLANPATDPWPAMGSQLQTLDHDGDGKPGITAQPRTDPPFAAPPLDLLGALNPNGARGDRLYIATRTVVQLEGTRTSCTEAGGTARVYRIDSHIVGCHVLNGGDCNATQAKFVDDNQPKFTIGSASYTMIQVDPSSTCAQVRAAMP